MFPESFVERWIHELTQPGDTVLDPFCGRGTTPYQALLMGRQAVANDINPVAYCITRAKTNPPSLSAVRRRVTLLEKCYVSHDWDLDAASLPEFFSFAYHGETLRQLLFLRRQLKWGGSNVDCMVAAVVLGALHGESHRSPSYLSNRMPRTISTKPAYSVRYWRERQLVAPQRNVFAVLRRQLAYRYVSQIPPATATVRLGDMRELHRIRPKIRAHCVITSPPYLDITNFEEDQWLRLWFLGGPPRPAPGRISRDDRLETPDRYWRLVADMWRVLGQVLGEGSRVVVRIGGKNLRPKQIIEGLEGTAVFSTRTVRLISHEESPIRKRQTPSFRPGPVGLAYEVDCVFSVA